MRRAHSSLLGTREVDGFRGAQHLPRHRIIPALTGRSRRRRQSPILVSGVDTDQIPACAGMTQHTAAASTVKIMRHETTRVARDSVSILADTDAGGLVPDHPGPDQCVAAVETRQLVELLVNLRRIGGRLANAGTEHEHALAFASEAWLAHV